MRIRPIALCLLEHEGRYLLQEFWHEPLQNHYYRAPGGGIELGEPALDAVRREMREELHTEIEDLRPVSIFENIFEYEGEQKHEIVFLFSGRPAERSLLEQEIVHFSDNDIDFRAVWVSREEILAGGPRTVFPKGMREVLAGKSGA